MDERDDTSGRDDNTFPREDPPSEEPGALVVECSITTPANDELKKGPKNGVTIVVEGEARIVSGTGAIERVEIQFGDAPFAMAEPVDGWAKWKGSKLVATAGVLPITAQAVVGGQPVAAQTIAVRTELAATENPDTTPPGIAILSPKPNASVVVSAGNPQEIVIAGTSSDVGSGVEKVEVKVDGSLVPVSKVSGKLDNWKAKATLVGVGRHTITATAIDHAGLLATSSVQVVASGEPAAPPVVERLLLVEKLRLATYLGRYGYGRPIKTISLLPGEKASFAVKSYKRTSETTTEASSILDETSTESLKEFEEQLTREQTNRQAVDESSAWEVAGEAQTPWGLGFASISAGASGSTNASREELAKNIRNAVQKQASKASAKRVVEVKTSREMKREEGEEYSSESHVENINVSRTLNFVFTQINQEFKTLLLLHDVRLAYVRGDAVEGEDGEEIHYSYREVSLSQLDGLLRQVVVPERREDVRRAIVNVLENVFDYKDEHHSVIEEVELKKGKDVVGTYLRFHPIPPTKYELNGEQIDVPGLILDEMTNVMRTDGVICEAILGKGVALDPYSAGLQREAVEARALENERQREAVNKERLALKLISEKDAEGAKIFKDVFPEPEQESLALVTTNTGPNGSSG